jgi:chromosome segregation ATPase
VFDQTTVVTDPDSPEAVQVPAGENDGTKTGPHPLTEPSPSEVFGDVTPADEAPETDAELQAEVEAAEAAQAEAEQKAVDAEAAQADAEAKVADAEAAKEAAEAAQVEAETKATEAEAKVAQLEADLEAATKPSE